MASALRVALVGALWALSAATVGGEQQASTSILRGLDKPCALAVRVGASRSVYQVYVAEAGAGRIVRVRGESGEAAPVIVGFPTGAEGALGNPRAMALLDSDALAVSWTTGGDQPPVTAVYTLPEDGQTLAADEHRQVADARRADASGPLTALAADARYLYASQHAAGAVSMWRARNNVGVLGGFRPLATLDSPHAAPLVVSPDGYLVAAYRRQLDGGDCRVEFYDPHAERGSLRLALDVELADVRGLAYGALPRPAARLLYAINGEEAPRERQGVYRLDATLDERDRPAVREVLVAKAPKPTALAFGPDGALYVTTAGDGDSSGELLRFEGGF